MTAHRDVLVTSSNGKIIRTETISRTITQEISVDKISDRIQFLDDKIAEVQDELASLISERDALDKLRE